MTDFAALGLAANLGVFAAAAATIGWCGSRLARLADRLADRTGLGEALVGGVLLGASTSLPGIVGTAFVAHAGRADFAVSHAFGGMAIQLAFLAVVDLFYRRANLEHAAASLPNLVQALLLIALLAAVVFVAAAPPFEVLGVHPFSIALPIAYLLGLRLVQRAGSRPMWRAVATAETREDRPAPGGPERLDALLAGFALLAAATAVAGWALANAGVAIADEAGLSQSLVGGVFTTMASSLPELVTAYAAMRIGALTLAVGSIIGGNVFDCLFLTIADVAYPGGSVYHAVSGQTLGLLGLALLESALLALGLAIREPKGAAGIGFESLLILLAYAGGIAFIYLAPP